MSGFAKGTREGKSGSGYGGTLTTLLKIVVPSKGKGGLAQG